MRNKDTCRIGTAGRSVPSVASSTFGTEGSQLQRYSIYFSCVEIDSSFYRPHRAQTYARWAASVPSSFRFAVKAPRAITHEAKLRDAYLPLQIFFDQVRSLGSALGPILIQLPPILDFNADLTEILLGGLRKLYSGGVVFEPRHTTCFSSDADQMLHTYCVGRVAADPALSPIGAVPGGWVGLRYWRLHGSPRMYFTPYGEDRLRLLADVSPNDWCIFDNTASGAALTDAVLLQTLVET